MTDQGPLSGLVLTEAVTVSADYEDVRPWLLLRTEADPGPGPAGEVEEAAPGQDLLQLAHLGLPRGCEGGAVQLLPQVEEDEVDGPVVNEAEEVAGAEVGVAAVVPDIQLKEEVSLHQSGNILRYLTT